MRIAEAGSAARLRRLNAVVSLVSFPSVGIQASGEVSSHLAGGAVAISTDQSPDPLGGRAEALLNGSSRTHTIPVNLAQRASV